MENFIRKVTSRKFLMALATFIAGLIVALGGNEKTAETVVGLITSAAAAIAYITGESCVDSANVSATQHYYTAEYPHVTNEALPDEAKDVTAKVYAGAHQRESKTPEEDPPDDEEDDF